MSTKERARLEYLARELAIERTLAAHRMADAEDKAVYITKQVKEEILATAWKQPPTQEELKLSPDVLDLNIEHYLTRHFNPQGFRHLDIAQRGTLARLEAGVKISKEGAQISRQDLKTILDKHAAAAPVLKPRPRFFHWSPL